MASKKKNGRKQAPTEKSAPQNLIRDPATGVSDRQQVALQIDGRRRTYDLHVEPNRDDNGRVAGLSCVAVDITFPP
jgi:hypothetical protein